MPANLGYGLIVSRRGPSKKLMELASKKFTGFSGYDFMNLLYPGKGEPWDKSGLKIEYHRCQFDGVGDRGIEPLALISSVKPPGTKRQPRNEDGPLLWSSASAYKTESASDFTPFLAALAKYKEEWNKRLAGFVERCKKHGIELTETEPHPILYMEASTLLQDDLPPGTIDW